MILRGRLERSREGEDHVRGETKEGGHYIRENIHSSRYGRPRGIFVTIARDLEIILKLEDTRFYVGGFLY